MKFYADWRTVNTRYTSSLTFLFATLLAIVIFAPLFPGNHMSALQTINKLFFSSFELTGGIAIFFLIAHINFYYDTQKSTKLLEILESKLIFNFFNRKTLELNYLDISCLNYTQDIFKNFQFTLKNGEIKKNYK